MSLVDAIYWTASAVFVVSAILNLYYVLRSKRIARELERLAQQRREELRRAGIRRVR